MHANARQIAINIAWLPELLGKPELKCASPGRGISTMLACTLFGRVAFQQHSVIYQPSLWSVVTTRD
jgi:hypothetical protein